MFIYQVNKGVLTILKEKVYKFNHEGIEEAFKKKTALSGNKIKLLIALGVSTITLVSMCNVVGASSTLTYNTIPESLRYFKFDCIKATAISQTDAMNIIGNLNTDNVPYVLKLSDGTVLGVAYVKNKIILDLIKFFGL